MRVYSNALVEHIAQHRLLELERRLGVPLRPPIPIDLIAEHVLDLDLTWDAIEELPGETILAGLIPAERLIVLNDRHLALFQDKPGLERSSKGHEMGHWDLFVDRSTLDHPTLPGVASPGQEPVFRGSPAGTVQVFRGLLRLPGGVEVIRELVSRADHPEEARAVNRYAAAISMPREFMRERIAQQRPRAWPELYELARECDVTISALTVRLDQLNLLHVDADGQIHESRAHAAGQLGLL